MSSFTFYDGTIPHATAAMNVLLQLFDQIEAHAAGSDTSVDTLISARLTEDMFSFPLQVFIASEMALRMVAHLRDIEPLADPSGPEGLKTLEDMRRRVNAIIQFVGEADREGLIGAETEVTFNMGPNKQFTAKAHGYVNGFALPNLYFHTVTAYAILRHHGVKLGKLDYQDSYLKRYLY